MRFKSLLLIGLGLLSLCGCKESKAQQGSANPLGGEEGNYRFISREFSSAINDVNANSFFLPPLPKIPEGENEFSEEKKKQRHSYRLSNHYREIGDHLCSKIAVSYGDLLEETMLSDNANVFDVELIDAMKKAGAYVLPLRVIEGNISGTYTNGDPEFLKTYLDIPESQRLYQKPELNDGVLEVIAKSYPNGGGDYKYFHTFHSLATKNGYKLQHLNYAMDFTV